MPSPSARPGISRAAACLVVAAGLAVAGCGQGSPNPVGTASSPAATPSPSVSARAASSSRPLAPLTGLPAASAAAATRRAVALVVSGTDPQGLSAADLVFEEITTPVRYIAVYQSDQDATVGPITTTQPTDRAALIVLHPLIGYDGAAAAFFVKLLDATKITDAGYGRNPSLYASTAAGLTTSPRAIAQAVPGGAPPPPLFQYRGPGSASTLASSGISRPASATVAIPGLGSQHWAFDARSDRWALTSGGPAVQAANLVIQMVQYKTVTINRRHGIAVSVADVTGTGRAEVFSGSVGGGTTGTAAPGTWAKLHNAQLTNYLDSSGVPMTFQPGPTWILLAPPGTQVSTGGPR